MSIEFIRESNRIEGILREPTKAEIVEFVRFMALDTVGINDLIDFVGVYQPNAVFRDKKTVPRVRVGNHIAPPSGPGIRRSLESILKNMFHSGAYWTHIDYETLHPFTDGNGRSGRMLWAWQMGYSGLSLGFLHKFYYQTLEHSDGRND